MAVAVKKYNPGFLSDDDIVASFCVRSAEFESLIESLRECDASSSPHSLVIGPRGSGKTHLLLRVAAEVRRDPVLDGLFPIVFAEESYEVTTCGEFWLECLGRLAQQAPSEERDNLRLTYDELRTVTDDQALADRCIGSLLDFADRHQTRLVLLVENLNMLFSDIDDSEVGWRLRQTLQTEPRIILFGTATSRFEEIDNPEHALYDLFRVISLRSLDTDECKTLWQTVAGKPSTGEAVRPLEILTGGNPRLLTIIARFGAGRSFRDLMENLLDLVDEHTEYFKSHLESLPPQERRVYLALARLWKPATTREVADLARLNTSTCSAQLKRLVQRGSVAIEGGTPRRRQYYLTERLYNIYYLMRRGTGADRLVTTLIDFMICLYSPSELRDLIKEVSKEYHSSDILLQNVPVQMAEALVSEAQALANKGKPDEALELYDHVAQKLGPTGAPQIDPQVAVALMNKSLLLGSLGRELEAIATCTDLVSQFGDRSEPVFLILTTVALDGKGNIFFRQGNPTDALRAYNQALVRIGQLETPELRFLEASIIQHKGLALIHANRLAEALSAFDQIVTRYGSNTESQVAESVATALKYRSLILDIFGRTISEDEFLLLLERLAEAGSLAPGGIDAVVPFIASIEPAEALVRLQASPAANLLLPLIVALQQELGLTSQVSREIEEVAKDVRERLAKARAKRLLAPVDDDSA